jgi:microcompartment protein CcmL/EutN
MPPARKYPDAKATEKLHLLVAMALGGKGLCLMTGTVADVRAGMQAAADEVRRRGLLVSEIVIPRPSKELFGDYL